MIDNHFGLKLKEFRERAGWTQPELAARSGLSKGGIADLEQGRREPSWSTVQTIAAALGVTPNNFQEPPGPDVGPRGPGRPKKVEAPPAKVTSKRK